MMTMSGGLILEMGEAYYSLTSEGRKAHGKYAENHGIFKEFIPQPLAEEPVYAVISGHFRSFLQSFPVIPGYDSDSFRFLSVFIPFHSFSFPNPMFFFLKC